MSKLTPKPFDWTYTTGRPAPGSSNGGFGLIPGYQPVSIFDPLKPNDTIDKLPHGVLIYEYESGVGGHQTDAQFFPKAAFPECQAVARGIRGVWATDSQNRPVGFYGLPYLRLTNIPAYRDALGVMDKAGIFKACEYIVASCGRAFENPFGYWASEVSTVVAEVRKFCDKPLVIQIGEQWHANSQRHGDEYIPQADIVEMLEYAKGLKGVYTIARHGGYDNQGPIGLNGQRTFRRLAWGSNPAESAINKILTGA